MADTPGDVGVGGGIDLTGSAASMCAISPSDLVGTLDNLITRIEKLEQAVTQLLTANINANQISDLATQIGWVGGVTFLGTPGWTQTSYGTLIPPEGWSLLDSGLIPHIPGSGLQIVYTDAEGNLTSLADLVSGGGTPDFYKFSLNPSISESSGITEFYNLFELTAGVYNRSLAVTVAQRGLYLCKCSASFVSTTSSSLILGVTGDMSANNVTVTYPDQDSTVFSIQFIGSSHFGTQIDLPTASVATLSQVDTFLMDEGGIITIEAEAVPFIAAAPADLRFNSVDVTVIYLGNVS